MDIGMVKLIIILGLKITAFSIMIYSTHGIKFIKRTFYKFILRKEIKEELTFIQLV